MDLINRLLSRPATLLALTFLVLILVGTAALAAPIAHGDKPVSLLDAFFTATSAVCVTGLSTVEGGAAGFSRFGQIVILVLIQLGGLGLMTFGAIAAQIFRVRVSFSSQAALQDLFFQTETRGNLNAALRRIVVLVLACELTGAALIYMETHDAPAGGSGAGAFDALFLSVSAFCNAGFSVYADSLESFANSPIVMVTIMLLITLGGLGYTVLFETGQFVKKKLLRRIEGPVRLSLNTRVVLITSAALTVGGAFALLVTGIIGGEHAFDQLAPALPREERLFGSHALHALFQSVTARTAGFNTVRIDRLPVPSLLIFLPLMFIGGSPGSTAGGVKTTSLAVYAARLRSRLAGKEDVNIRERHVPHDIVRRAALVIGLASLWCAIGVMLLAVTEPAGHGVRFEHLVFEQISAFGTVGLSAGVTPGLSALGKLWIVLSMFVGRLGPLTIALAVMPQPRPRVAYPVERVMIG